MQLNSLGKDLEKLSRVTELDDMIKMQSQSGNWDYNEFMYGMLIGMLCVEGILSGEEPTYPAKPKAWKEDSVEEHILEEAYNEI